MRVALITLDSRVYYMASKVLKKYGVGFHSLLPGETLPPEVEVVLTDEKTSTEINFPRKIIVRDEGFIDELLAELNGMHPERIYLAIDPGERPGLSVLGDNSVIEVMHLSNPRDIEPIMNLLKKYPGAKIKIGHGAKRYRMLLLRALEKELGESYRIILVDETGTTPKVSYTEGRAVKDIVAAINIGLRNGREVSIEEALTVDEPSKGEIDYIKRKSREMSGSITISTELAKEVALGRMTIEEAISAQRRGKIRKGGGRYAVQKGR